MPPPERASRRGPRHEQSVSRAILSPIAPRARRKQGLKALSLLLAVLLFIVSRQPIIDLRLVGVPIEYRGLSPGVKIVGSAEQTVSVRLSGPRDIVRSLTPNQLLVIADLSGKEPGERVVQLKMDEG